MRIHATARKRGNTPMGRTGTAGLRLYLTWPGENPMSYSAKAQLGGL